MPDRGSTAQHSEVATRAQAVALKLAGVLNAKIEQFTGLITRQIQRWFAEAKVCGLDPTVSTVLLDKYFMDKPKSGRPKKGVDEALLATIHKDQKGRESTCAELAVQLEVSPMTIWRTLRANRLYKRKPTWKPGLTDRMRQDRLAFAKRHEHWTLEDWKKVIWTDETSVVLGHRRGAVRVWRDKGERQERSCIRQRWHGASEFMFWGCFSWDFKGPCHI